MGKQGDSLSPDKYTGRGRKRRDPPGVPQEAVSQGRAGVFLLQPAGWPHPCPMPLPQPQPSITFCSSQCRLGPLCWEPSGEAPLSVIIMIQRPRL